VYGMEVAGSNLAVDFDFYLRFSLVSINFALDRICVATRLARPAEQCSPHKTMLLIKRVCLITVSCAQPASTVASWIDQLHWL
jgi:hypothetical protein